MLTADLLMGFVAGTVTGVIVSLYLLRRGMRAVFAEIKKTEEEKEKQDPANWWKYGGDPYGRSNYDTDDGVA